MAITIDDMKAAIKEAIDKAIEYKITPAINNAIDKAIEDKMTPAINNAIEDKITPTLKSIEARLENSYAGREEELKWPPHKESGLPYAAGETITINCLLVPGNEKLPNGKTNNWNKTKSRAALEYYGEKCESDEEKSEYSASSRARRLRLARVLGVSSAQLNFAQLAL